MKKSIEKLLDRIRENDWSVTVRGNYINIGKYSPAGQDFCFDIDVTDFEEYLICCMYWNGGTLTPYTKE